MIELTDEPRPRPGGRPEPPRTEPSPRTRCATCGCLLLQIPINQKEAGQVVLADQLELVRELLFRFFAQTHVRPVRRIAIVELAPAERRQHVVGRRLLLAVLAREIRKVVAKVAMIGQIERGTPLGDSLRTVDRLRITLDKYLRHHSRRTQKEFAVRPPQAMRAFERRRGA